MVPGQTITLTYNGGGKTRRDNQAVMCKESGRSKCRKDGTSGADGSMNPYSNFLAGEGLLDVWYLKLDCDEVRSSVFCSEASIFMAILWANLRFYSSHSVSTACRESGCVTNLLFLGSVLLRRRLA